LMVRAVFAEAEWEKAARGIDQRLYTWGNAEPSQTLANFGYRGSMGYGVLTNFGSFERGRSPYGAYDLAGNVWEWIADWYDSDYYSKSSVRNPKGPSVGEYRVLRGGSWFNGPREMRSVYRDRIIEMARGAAIGFRCAQDAPK
jgi:formylglycine-generating enzyme required for sulfatase activity